jgi:hypothetical protein
LSTARKRKSNTITTLRLGSDAAVDGDNCGRNLASITAGALRLGTRFW